MQFGHVLMQTTKSYVLVCWSICKFTDNIVTISLYLDTPLSFEVVLPELTVPFEDHFKDTSKKPESTKGPNTSGWWHSTGSKFWRTSSNF